MTKLLSTYEDWLFEYNQCKNYTYILRMEEYRIYYRQQTTIAKKYLKQFSITKPNTWIQNTLFQ